MGRPTPRSPELTYPEQAKRNMAQTDNSSQRAASALIPYLLQTRTGRHPLNVRVARTFFSRFFGLMLRGRLGVGRGLLLMRCPSVHTAFMRFAIDVLYLDDSGVIRKCVSNLKPWRCSLGPARQVKDDRTARGIIHTLELDAGSIARFGVRPGDRLVEGQPAFPCRPHTGERQETQSQAAMSGMFQPSQRGAAMLEFILVGPLITLIGLGALQYGLLFFDKNQINHASFMAGRAGAMGNASLERVRSAYEKALIPLYGGGRNPAELAAALARAQADVGQHVRIELLNPTPASFDDWNDPVLQQTIGGGRRVIPNGNLAFKDPGIIGAHSGQNIQDANLIKLRITHGVEPKVPLVRTLYSQALAWLDPGTDAFHTQLIDAGRVPVVTQVTLHMQSDAIESDGIMQPDPNPPDDGGDGTGPSDPPGCTSGTCPGDTPTPADPGGGGEDGAAACTGPDCPTCEDGASVQTRIDSDVLFPFDQSALTAEGRELLDTVIAEAQGMEMESLHIIGYTDPLGEETYNQALSLARAEAVRNYLTAHGFPDIPITIEGRGEQELEVQLEQCPDTDDAALKDCLAPNRRVILQFKGVKQA